MKNYTTPVANVIALETADVITASSMICQGVAKLGWGDFKSNSYVDDGAGFDF